MSITPKTMVVRTESLSPAGQSEYTPEEVTIPLNRVTRAEVWRKADKGRLKRNIGTGALIGMGIGSLFGLAGYAETPNPGIIVAPSVALAIIGAHVRRYTYRRETCSLSMGESADLAASRTWNPAGAPIPVGIGMALLMPPAADHATLDGFQSGVAVNRAGNLRWYYVPLLPVLRPQSHQKPAVRIEQRLHLFDGSGAGKHHARLR